MSNQLKMHAMLCRAPYNRRIRKYELLVIDLLIKSISLHGLKMLALRSGFIYQDSSRGVAIRNILLSETRILQ